MTHLCVYIYVRSNSPVRILHPSYDERPTQPLMCASPFYIDDPADAKHNPTEHKAYKTPIKKKCSRLSCARFQMLSVFPHAQATYRVPIREGWEDACARSRNGHHLFLGPNTVHNQITKHREHCVSQFPISAAQ